MTTTSSAPDTGALRTPSPPGAAALVLLAATGPLAIAALRAVLPYSSSDTSAVIAAAVAADPAAQSAVLVLGYVALLTLPLGVLVVGRAAVAARPVLGATAAVLSWVGFTSLFWLTGADQLALAGVESGADPATVGSLIDAMGAHPVAGIATTAFVVGHILGTVLLGVALWRVLPRWVAFALIASQPLHLVFAVLLPNPWLDALAWAATALGFGWAALAPGRAR